MTTNGSEAPPPDSEAQSPAPPLLRDSGEFASLPAARRRGPGLIPSLVVFALSLVMLWHQRADLRYALGSTTPRDLGDAAMLSTAAPLSDDSYVTLSGIPDRRNSLYVELTNVRARQTLFRLLGTDSRVLVRAIPHPGGELAERWTGRLRRFDAMPYAPALRDYFAHSAEVRALGYVDLVRLGEILAGKQSRGTLVDRSGRALALADATSLTATVNHDDQLLASLPKRRHPQASDARYELAQAGLVVVEAAGDDPEYFDFAVAIGGAGRDAAIAKLEALGAEVRLRRTHHVVRLDRITGGSDGLDIDGKRVAWSAVESVSFEAPIVIPSNAFVLTEGEAPRSQPWTLVLGGLLAAFALYGAWSLLRLRRS